MDPAAVMGLAPGELAPDWSGGSILNLTATVARACGLARRPYATCPAVDALALHEAPAVVLLVVDGLGERFLAEHGAGTLLTRSRRAVLTSVFPSTTATAITLFLSGWAPARHALTGWHVWFEELGRIVAPLPLRARGPTIPDAPAGDPAALARRLFDYPGLFEDAARETHVISPAEIAGSAFNRHHTSGAAHHAYAGLPELFERLGEVLEAAARPAFVYAYWPVLDAVAHEHGIGSEAARAALHAFDAELGQFAARASGSGARVLVTADHGFIDAPEARVVPLGSLPTLGAMLERPLWGERRVAFCAVRAEARAGFPACVARELPQARCVDSRTLAAAGWFGPPPASPSLASRAGDFALVMREDWTLVDWMPGERPYRLVGVHGGLSEREMRVPLAVIDL